MKKCFVALLGLVALAAILAMTAMPAWAAPAETLKGTGCLVQDANGTSYYDADCNWHQVIKRDEDGNIVFVYYHDQGSLPANAVFPKKAVRSTIFINCGGCALQGTYEYVVTPSGEYHSSGPN